MKEIEYIPECFSEGVFSGRLVLSKPSVDDLFEGSAIAKKASEDQDEASRQMLKWSKKFYREVDIKCIDGSRYESFDDLYTDAECMVILSEVSTALVMGLNKKKLAAPLLMKTQEKGKSNNK